MGTFLRKLCKGNMQKVLVLLVLCCFLGVYAQNSTDSQCPGKPNLLPISIEPPTFVNKSQHGKLYVQTSVSPPLWVLHVYGTPYEMGYAQGELLRSQMNDLIPAVFEYMYTQINQYIGFLPQWAQEVIDKFGTAFLLDLTWELCKDYTPQHFKDEMQGLADGSGLPVQQIIQMHMIPELIKAHCSMVGAWGVSISTTDGSLYQLRALDWDTNGPFQEYPQVTVYHPNDNDGQAFSILTWSGFVGALSGYSSASIGLCEKVWLSYNGTSSRSGDPWPFVLRDILQYDVDIDSAINRLTSVERTCSIFVGLGDNTINQFRAIEYSHEFVRVGDDRNFPVWEDHPSYDDVVYIDKHKQPSSDPCLGSLISEYYGRLDCTTMLQYVAPQHETGDMHVALYDFSHNYMYVSNASPANGSQVIPAYERSYIRLDMSALFSESL